MKQIIRLTESDLRSIIQEAVTMVQYDLFGGPEVKRIRKTRKDKMTPEQKKAAKAERDEKKKIQKEKDAEEAWAKRGVIQTKLNFDESKNSQQIIESFNHWKSPKLAQMVKQHGMPYGNGTATYFLTQLRDDNVADEVTDKPLTNKYIQFKDKTYVDVNTNDNEVARDYFGLWAGKYTNKYVDKVRPNNGFAAARDFNHIDSDFYSRQHYKPSTRRAEDARELRHNPYFIDGKDKEYNPNSGWNRKEANRIMNNLRNGKDRYGNENKPSF